MKIKLTCSYGEGKPGDVIDVAADEAKFLIEVAKGAVAHAEEKAADEKPAAPAKGK